MQRFKDALVKHHKSVVQRFHEKHAETLNKAKKHTIQAAAAGVVAIAGMHGHIQDINHTKNTVIQRQQKEIQNLKAFLDELPNLLKEKTTLSVAEEKIISQTLSKKFGLNLTYTLNGNRLNEISGYMGAEQHLYRWKGDTLANHDLQRAGIAPLQGAFKDFDNEEQERYYVAVQLHELPNWNTKWSTLKPWYRYRKVFVYNPANQKGIVAVIGDAGPSKFTGKTFGGSPEVMDHLEMVDGARKGKAIILFIDDPENKIALGPANAQDVKFLATNYEGVDF